MVPLTRGNSEKRKDNSIHMNELIIFNNEEFGEIRTITIDGEPWFVGKDVAAALGYKDPSSAVSKNVDLEDKTTLLIQQDGSNYKSRTTFINESGMYALIFGSKLESAKNFKHWVTSDVLPAIRKTGNNNTNNSITEITVQWDDDIPYISARELHEALQIKTRFNDWFLRMIAYGFDEGKDFYSKMSKTPIVGGRPATDYQISVDMAKEICMIQRTNLGKQYREYFLELEKKWNSPEQVMARALQYSHQKIQQLEVLVNDFQHQQDTFFATEELRSMSTASKEIGIMGRNKLYAFLRKHDIMYYDNGVNVPYQQFVNQGYFRIKERLGRDGRYHPTTMATTKGMDFIRKILKQKTAMVTAMA